MRRLILLGILCLPLFAQDIDYVAHVQNKPQVYALDYGCRGDGTTDNTACFTKLFAASVRKSVLIPPGSYHCNNGMAQSFRVDAVTVHAEGATFLECLFTTTGATGGLTWTGGVFDTTAIKGAAGPPVWQVSHDNTTFLNVRFAFTKNYTAIQIGTPKVCPDDVIIDGIRTTANGESHMTVTCGSAIRVSNWELNGTGDEDGLALLPVSGPINNVAIANVTAINTYTLLKLANAVYPVSNVTLDGWSCTDCYTPIYLQGIPYMGLPGTSYTNINVSNGTVIDLTGAHLVNAFFASSTFRMTMQNVTLRNIQGFGRFNNTGHEAAWIRLLATPGSGAVFKNFDISDNTFITSGSSSGSEPIAVIFGANDYPSTPWAGFKIRNNVSNGGTLGCLFLQPIDFATQADLDIAGNYFSNCSNGDHARPAHTIYGRAIWEHNQTILYPNQPELFSFTTKYPLGVSYAELTGTAYAGAVSGVALYCYDCAPTTPATAQSAALGGANCMRNPRGYWACSSWNGQRLPAYANNAAALAGGLAAGDVYRTGSGVLMVVF